MAKCDTEIGYDFLFVFLDDVL